MEIKNIITIDFDIIMAPSIEMYNPFVGEEYGIDYYAKYHNNLLKFCNADLELYSSLTYYFLNIASFMERKNIHFIYQHNHLCSFLDKEKKYNIYNIDHHHDCGYPNSNSELYCGNWVDKLQKQNLIENYYWITDINAQPMPAGYGDKLFIEELDLYSLPTPDLFIICASFDWIPEQFKPLFYLWLNLYNLYFNKNEDLIIESIVQKNRVEE